VSRVVSEVYPRREYLVRRDLLARCVVCWFAEEWKIPLCVSAGLSFFALLASLVGVASDSAKVCTSILYVVVILGPMGLMIGVGMRQAREMNLWQQMGCDNGCRTLVRFAQVVFLWFIVFMIVSFSVGKVGPKIGGLWTLFVLLILFNPTVLVDAFEKLWTERGLVKVGTFVVWYSAFCVGSVGQRMVVPSAIMFHSLFSLAVLWGTWRQLRGLRHIGKQ